MAFSIIYRAILIKLIKSHDTVKRTPTVLYLTLIMKELLSVAFGIFPPHLFRQRNIFLILLFTVIETVLMHRNLTVIPRHGATSMQRYFSLKRYRPD